MHNDALSGHLTARQEDHVSRLRELVRQPSISPERRGGREYAGLLAQVYADLGCQAVHVVDTGDEWPGVWAYFDAGARNTIATYSYFDTYGVKADDWSFPPFEGITDSFDGFPRVMIGRGASLRGSHLAWIGAIEATAAVEGSLPVNVLFLSEGAEMMGSPNFDRICEDAAAHMDEVDAFVSPRISESRSSRDVSVTLGYKNMVTFDLTCQARTWGRGPYGGTVYGNSKSVVDSPTHRLVQAVASMIGRDGNQIAISGLEGVNAERKTLTTEERELIEEVVRHFAGEKWNSVLPTAEGVEQWAGVITDDDVLFEYLYGPSINVSDVRTSASDSEPRVTMLLPDAASATIELRFVTDLPAREVIRLAQQHLVDQGFGEVTLTPQGVWEGSQVSREEPVVRAALETLLQHGRSPVVWPIQPFGGPWAGVPRRLGIPTISGCSLGYGANGAGAANEYLVLESDGSVAGFVEAERYLCDLLSNTAARLEEEA